MMAILYSFIATIGFALLFHLRGVSVLWAAITGAIAWAIVVLISALGASAFLANACGAFAVTGISEILVILTKRPAVAFLLPGLIPLVPGSPIYTAIALAVRREFSASVDKGFEALSIAVALVLGVVLASGIVRVGSSIRAARKGRRRDDPA